MEEMLCESRIAEDKAKKAMIDAARLADELRGEQENAQQCEKNRRSLECQVKDMQTKLDEAEQQAVKGGRKVTSRLEQKIKDLESQFDDEQRRLVEAEKSQRRTTRRIKELTFSQEEDHKVLIFSLFTDDNLTDVLKLSHCCLILFTHRTTSGCRSWWTSCRTR